LLKAKQTKHPKMSFEYNNYSIVSSLNERTIYIKVIDTITFMCYESNIDSKELRLSIELSDAYKLMSKCFLSAGGYNVNISVNTGIMKLAFAAVVEGYLKINFEIMLREKVMSNDGQLTLNFNRIEQKQAQAIQVLTQKLAQLEGLVDALSYAEICMLQTNHQQNTGQYPTAYWKMNTTEMTLNGNQWDYGKIYSFYKLEKLTFTSCGDISTFKHNKISNKTVKEIILNGLSGLSAITGLDEFPQLEKITFTSCNSVRDVVAVLNSYKHKIKHIIINSCAKINNTELNSQKDLSKRWAKSYLQIQQSII
jgi:hypothetical protein